MRRSLSCFLVMAILSFTVSTVWAQQASTTQLQHLVQMPVAMDKATQSEVDPLDLESLSRALNRGQIDPANFNATLRQAPVISTTLRGITDVGEFTTSMLRLGLTGEELAHAVRAHLLAKGIPAGGNPSKQPPPIAEKFIPEKAQSGMSNRPAQAGNRPEIGPDNHPGSSSKPEMDRRPEGIPGGEQIPGPGNGSPGGVPDGGVFGGGGGPGGPAGGPPAGGAPGGAGPP